jgi:hypothetical protein
MNNMPGASNMRKSSIGHHHHPIRHLLASRMKFPVGTGSVSQEGRRSLPRHKKQQAAAANGSGDRLSQEHVD